MIRTQPKKNINELNLTIIVFSLFFSWLLAFPFEGQILYGLAAYYNISAQPFIVGALIAHFTGLLVCSFFIKNMKTAKNLMIFSIAFCIAASVVFFFPPSFLWWVSLILSSFFVSCCLAAWGFYFKGFTPKNERIKTMADGLIFSNLLMILMNILSVHISPQIGLSSSILILATSFFFALRLPKEEIPENHQVSKDMEVHVSKTGTLAFLYLFIVVITINSGLMYQVQAPYYVHLEWLTSWYWAMPYIAALFVMRNLPRKINRTYILYIAISMIGLSFISFVVLDRSWLSYLVVNTLMLGACGVYDLFWWSILGEMLELDNNPAKILGIGLSANVLGILLGGIIGNVIGSTNGQIQNPTLLALGVVCVTLVMLPPLHHRLTSLLKSHIFLTSIIEMPSHKKSNLVCQLELSEKFTQREREIATLLISGKTYRLIAAELYVSENTIKTHVKNIYAKAGVQSRTELINMMLDIHNTSE